MWTRLVYMEFLHSVICFRTSLYCKSSFIVRDENTLKRSVSARLSNPDKINVMLFPSSLFPQSFLRVPGV